MMVRLGYSDKVSSLDKKCAEAYFEMRSGVVNYIQGGNKWNDVGTATMKIYGPATVTDEIQCGGTNFNVDTVSLSLSGAEIPVLYVGGYGKDSSHTATVKNVTVGAANSNIGKLYANRTDYCTITNKVSISLRNTQVGGINMSGGKIESAATVNLTLKNQNDFYINNSLAWVDNLKLVSYEDGVKKYTNSVYITQKYAGPATVTVEEDCILYLDKTVNTASNLPTGSGAGAVLLTTDTAYEQGDPITMYFDDHMDVSSYSRVIVSAAGSPTSYKVGYGITANTTKDTAVVTYNSSKKQLIATGVGTATVVLGNKIHNVTVEPAPISLFLMIGQSNMAGSNGNPNKSVVSPDGQVYTTLGAAGASWATTHGLSGMESLTTSTAINFVASALTGSKAGTNRAGTTTNLSVYPINSFDAAGPGKPGLDSGFAYEWNKLTGEKVWLVNAAHGGTSLGDWIVMDGDSAGVTGKEYKQAKAMFSEVLKTMKAEIAAGHYTLSHYAYFWCQGCADRVQTTDWYLDKFSVLHERLKTDFAFNFGDGKGTRTFESANMVLVRACGSDGFTSQNDTKKKDYWTYHDLEMNGVRTAQYYMANSNEAAFKDVHMVCNITDQLVYWDDAKTQSTVKEFFESRYPNGFDYKIQSGTISLPTKPEDVRGGDGDGDGDPDSGIHNNQIGYNEMGREAARNAVYRMYPELAPQEEVTIKLYAWDGVTDLAGKTDTEPLTEYQSVVPVVYPLYRSKDLVLSGDMLHDYSSLKGTDTDYTYYAIDGCQDGTVTATVGDVSVTYKLRPSGENKTFRWELVNGQLVAVSGDGLTVNALKLLTGTNSGGALTGASFRMTESVVLRHDQPWQVEWKGALHGSAGEGKAFFLLTSSRSANTLDAPNIIVSDHSVILNRRLDDGTAYTNYESAPYALNYFRHLRAKATIDLSTTHTYTLVNEVTASGNMVYLYIDGVKKSAMNLLVSDGTNLGTSDWMSGKDFVFSHIGAKSAGLSNVTDSAYNSYDYTLTGTLNYMQIEENRLVKTEAKAATCTTKGNQEYYTDPVTGKLYLDANGTQETTLANVTIAAGHDLTAEQAKAETCTADGNLAYWHCSVCDKYFKDAAASAVFGTDEWVIPAHGLSAVSANEASCATDGNLAYWYCQTCDKYYKDANASALYGENEWVIPAHGLSAVSANEASCAADGNLAYWYCQTCDKYYKDANASAAYGTNEWVIPGGHNLTFHAATPSSCTAAGNIAYWSCSVCGKNYPTNGKYATNDLASVEDPIDSHNLTAVETEPATCTNAGNLAYWYCSNCGKYYKDAAATAAFVANEWVLPAGHDLTHHAANPATEGQNGNTEYWSCDNCHQYFSDSEAEHTIPAGSWVIPALGAALTATPNSETVNPGQTVTVTVGMINNPGHVCGEIVLTAPDGWTLSSVTPTIGDADDVVTHGGVVVFSVPEPLTDATVTYFTAVYTVPANALEGSYTFTVTGMGFYGIGQVDGPTILPAAEFTVAADTAMVSIGHNLTAHTASEESCTSDGNIAYWSCDRCGKFFADEACETELDENEWVIPGGHQLVYVPAAIPDCENDGNIAHYKCTVCGSLFADQDASQSYTQDDVVDPKLWHDYDAIWTWSEDGQSVELYLDCKNCDHGFAVEVMEHRVIDSLDATCTTDGYITYQAIFDGLVTVSDTKTVKIPAHGLTAVGANGATCTEPGNLAYWHCQTCDVYYKDAEASATYDENEWVVPAHGLTAAPANGATCTENGNLAYWYCHTCGIYYKDAEASETYGENEWVVPAHGLTAVSAQPATCATDGNLAYWYCQTCGIYYKDANASAAYGENEWVIPGGHELTFVAAAQPGCTEDGNIQHWYCGACGKCFATNDKHATEALTNVVLPATGHSLTFVAAASADCVTDGNIAHWHCELCGKNYADEDDFATEALESVIEVATGHRLTHHTAVEAGCTVDGNVEYWSCDVCGKNFAEDDDFATEALSSVTITATGHELTHHEAQGSNCTDDGNVEYWSCSECGNNYGENNAFATETLDSVVDAADGHDMTHYTAVAPGKTTAGNIEYWYCSVCGKYFTDAEGENQVSQADTVLAPTSRWGDADRNGEITENDAIVIKLYRAGLITEDDLDLEVCDLDNNGKIDAYDAYLIQIYVEGVITLFPVEVYG